MNFEWYNPQSKIPTISIAEYGITISKHTLKLMGDPEYVMLGYDKENKEMAIKTCDENEIYGIKIKRVKLKDDDLVYTRINVKDFIRTINDYYFGKEAKRYIAIWDSENKMLTVNLTKEIERKHKNDSKRLNEKT